MSKADEFDEQFKKEYTEARKNCNYEDMARTLSGRLRYMDKRAKAANQRADALEAENKKLRELNAELLDMKAKLRQSALYEI